MAATGGQREPEEVLAEGDVPFRIFISYRRKDAEFHVERLRESLSRGVGAGPGFAEDQIFMDTDTIEPGVDFQEAIRKALEDSDVFLAVIGPKWLSDENRRRLQEADDFVRFEIEAAFERAREHDDVRIIPTLVQGGTLPAPEDLPEKLQKLPKRQYFELTDNRWSDDVGRLFASLKAREQDKIKAERERRLQEARDEAAAKQAAQEEAERTRIEREAADRAAAEQAERERAERVRAERERVQREAADRAEAEEQARREQAEREQARREQAEREQAEREEAERERARREQAERERAVREETDEERAAREAKERRRRLLLLGAVAAVVVIGVIVAAVVSGGPSEGGDGPEESGVLAWTRVDDSALGGEGDQEMNAIVTAAGGGTLLASGYDASAGDRDAAVWFSETGDTWERADAIRADGDQAIASVASVAGEAVAVGSDDSQGDRDLAVWRSGDGQQWESLGGLRLEGTDETVSRLTTGTDLGAVAGGWQTGDDGDDAAVWELTPDDSVQADVEPFTGDDLGGPGDQRISRIVQLADGGPLIAVGYADGDAGVWIYTDDTWQRVDDAALGGDGDEEMLDAATFGAQVAAVGVERRDGDTVGAVWLSDDGESWTRVDDTDGSLSADQPVSLNRVVRGGGDLPTLIAAGSAGGDAAVWTSEDGTSWQREPQGKFGGDGEQTVRSMRVKDGRLVAVGSTGAESSRDAAVWLGSAP